MAESHHRSDILFAFGVALLLCFAYLERDVLLLTYVSALFAVVLSPMIEGIRRIRIGGWHPGRGLAIFILLIGVLALLALAFAFMLPPIVRDARSLIAEWPTRAAQITERIQRLPLAGHLDVQTLQQTLAGAVGGVLGLFKKVTGGLLTFFSGVILTAYFILDGERAFHWVMSLFPAGRRARLQSTLIRAQGRVRHWLVGQAALMLILGVLSTITFAALQIKYSSALGFLAGLLNIVPIVGPLVSVVLAALVAGLDSWPKLLGVLVFYAVYQQIENAYLTPRIMRASVDLPALAVIIALSVGGALAGILGALVAVPTAAWVAVLVEEYIVDRNAGNPAPSQQ
ncbi:MAG TPA: AI-2E family transporter [Terriglobales bacterium]|nr:AI-2E family transporter [Terriglobales bacterium]